MAKVLYVDDDAGVRAALRVVLAAAGHECRGASNGEEALRESRTFRPDLVVLDVMLPDLNGFEVCERLRTVGEDVPVLFLSAKGDVDDRKEGLRCGADDYMAKPFDPEELVLRCAVLLKRARPSSEPGGPSQVSVGDLLLDLSRMECKVGSERVQLTPKEFQILAYMARRVGLPVTQAELVESVWGPEWAGEPTGVAVYVRRIRGKIESDPSHPEYLQTVWGVGYKLDAPGDGKGLG